MAYKPGQIIHRFTSRKNTEIIFKIPEIGTEKKYQKFVNSVITEDDYITLSEKQTLSDCKEHVRIWINKINQKKGFSFNIFYKGEIIGEMTLEFEKGRCEHVADLGIFIKDGFRAEGIGSEMMKFGFDKVKKMGVIIIKLFVLDTNIRAINVYKKLGFTKCGSMPYANIVQGNYVGDYIMYKKI